MALTWSAQLLCVIWRYHLWAACPCLSWFTVAFSRSIIVELDSEWSITSTFTQNVRALAHVQIWNVRAPWYPFIQFKFLVYGLTYRTYIHVHAICNAVTLVWGSLRLAPPILPLLLQITNKSVISTGSLSNHHFGFTISLIIAVVEDIKELQKCKILWLQGKLPVCMIVLCD